MNEIGGVEFGFVVIRKLPTVARLIKKNRRVAASLVSSEWQSKRLPVFDSPALDEDAGDCKN